MIDRVPRQQRGGRPPIGGLTLNLDHAVRTQIEQQAAGEGVRPWELVTRWVIERLRDDSMGDDRDEMWGEIDALREEIVRLGGALEQLKRQQQQAEQPRKQQAQAVAEPRTNGKQASGRTPLHMVIAQVLHEAGKPLSVGEIAEQIRSRNLFSGPRNGRPPSTSMISSRVAHTAYRGAFRRNKDRVSLAIPFDQLTAGRTIPED